MRNLGAASTAAVGRKSRPAQSPVPRSRRRVNGVCGHLVAVLGGISILLAAAPAEAYRFLNLLAGDLFQSDSEEWNALLVPTAGDAVRWSAEDFPLRFHLQDNIPDFLDEARWREMVTEALRQWSGIRTSEISLSLAPGLVAPGTSEDGTDANDGQLTIGWLSSLGEDSEFTEAKRPYC